MSLKPRIEIAVRALLIAVILCSALASTSALAKSAEEPEKQHKPSAFPHPEPRVGRTVNHSNKIDTIHTVVTDPIPGTPCGYWNFNEGSDITAYDLGTGAHNGTINGTAVWINGRYYDPNSVSPRLNVVKMPIVEPIEG